MVQSRGVAVVSAKNAVIEEPGAVESIWEKCINRLH